LEEEVKGEGYKVEGGRTIVIKMGSITDIFPHKKATIK
jgi:DNA repair photolyase